MSSRVELLEEAFSRAYGAQQPHRWTAMLVPPDTREGPRHSPAIRR